MIPKRVLFLCTGNSCRSQMAEGFARALASDVIAACSAGVEPHGMNPRAVRAMAEAGIDITGQSSKHVDGFKNAGIDIVVTVCDHANETCPTFPGVVTRIHTSFEDPPALARNAKSEEEAMSHYRRVRDVIRSYVEELAANLRKAGEIA
jgi:arsenate reductase (thioredoxin)